MSNRNELLVSIMTRRASEVVQPHCLHSPTWRSCESNERWDREREREALRRDGEEKAGVWVEGGSRRQEHLSWFFFFFLTMWPFAEGWKKREWQSLNIAKKRADFLSSTFWISNAKRREIFKACTLAHANFKKIPDETVVTQIKVLCFWGMQRTEWNLH